MVKWSEKGTVSGTTEGGINNVILEITNASRFSEVTILISNDGETNSMNYTYSVKVYPINGKTYNDLGWKSLHAGDMARILLNNSYEIIQVFASDGSGSTEYTVEWIGQYKTQLPR